MYYIGLDVHKRIACAVISAGTLNGSDRHSRTAAHPALSPLAGSEDGTGEKQIAVLLMEAGISYNKQRLHRAGYFRELLPLSQQDRINIEEVRRAAKADISGLGGH